MGGNILTYNESEDAYYIQYGADSVPKKLGELELKLFEAVSVTKGYQKTTTIPETGDFTLIVSSGGSWGGNALSIVSATVEYTIEEEYHSSASSTAYSYLILKIKATAGDTIMIKHGADDGNNVLATYFMF